uniref:Ret finger protein-like 4B n=1 Tax=Anthurium amnicola TaxID=1678845 RepID=A0A1D1Y0P1_9ARAE
MGHDEPLWRTNTSFSPPLSRRWEQRLQAGGLSYGSHGDGGVTLSSLSSNSKESRIWMRGEQLPHHTYSTSDGAMSYLSSPPDIFQAQQLFPPPVQGVHIDEYVSATMREQSSGLLPFPRFFEGTSGVSNSVGSISSRSEGSEYDAVSKIPVHSHRNFSSRRSFISKPVHPVSFPVRTPEAQGATESVTTMNSVRTFHSDMKSNQALNEPQLFSGFLDSVHYRREASRWSSGSSVDFTDISDQMEPDFLGCSINNIYDVGKCGLCERLLSQRSPWSSRRIIRSGDMPIAGVLSCRHVYHAECLERITPKTCKHDPPCPLCEKTEERAPEQWAISRLKNGLPRLRLLGEEGTSRSWSCGQVGDCVEGALHASPRNGMLLNRNRLKRHMSLKGSPGEDRADKSKRSGLCSPQGFSGSKLVEQGTVGCSRTAPASALKRL